MSEIKVDKTKHVSPDFSDSETTLQVTNVFLLQREVKEHLGLWKSPCRIILSLKFW